MLSSLCLHTLRRYLKRERSAEPRCKSLLFETGSPVTRSFRIAKYWRAPRRSSRLLATRPTHGEMALRPSCLFRLVPLSNHHDVTLVIVKTSGDLRTDISCILYIAGTQSGVPDCFTEYPQPSSLAAELWTPCCPLLLYIATNP